MHISTLRNIDFKRQNGIIWHDSEYCVFVLFTDTSVVFPLMGMTRVLPRTGISLIEHSKRQGAKITPVENDEWNANTNATMGYPFIYSDTRSNIVSDL